MNKLKLGHQYVLECKYIGESGNERHEVLFAGPFNDYDDFSKFGRIIKTRTGIEVIRTTAIRKSIYAEDLRLCSDYKYILISQDARIITYSMKPDNFKTYSTVYNVLRLLTEEDVKDGPYSINSFSPQTFVAQLLSPKDIHFQFRGERKQYEQR